MTVLFNQWMNLKTFGNNLSDTEKKTQSIQKLWCRYFKECVSEELYTELLKIAQFFFSIPAHNANVERIFSLINAQWTKERNKLNTETVTALIMTKFNFKNFTCSEFYDYIKNKETVLKQIGSVEKYQ